jgi:aryl-alcohol dehydrogenase-like predicted oxidoreductase
MSTAQQLPQAVYRRLGNSGLRVSFPILGCMSFGSSKVMPFALDEDEVGIYPH